MNKLLTLSFFSCCLLCAANAFSLPNFNLSNDKKALKNYHDSNEYRHDIESEISGAKIYLTERFDHAPTPERKKMVIVYDIDETSLSNYQPMIENDFGAPKEYVLHTEESSLLAPIVPTLNFYHDAEAKGITQIFITGRPEMVRSETIENLHKAGYSNWQFLYLEPAGSHFKSAADFKAKIRKSLIDQGYDIVLSIGDQCSDLADSALLNTPAAQQITLPKACGKRKGAYEEMAVKLPNPYYYLP